MDICNNWLVTAQSPLGSSWPGSSPRWWFVGGWGRRVCFVFFAIENTLLLNFCIGIERGNFHRCETNNSCTSPSHGNHFNINRNFMLYYYLSSHLSPQHEHCCCCTQWKSHQTAQSNKRNKFFWTVCCMDYEILVFISVFGYQYNGITRSYQKFRICIDPIGWNVHFCPHKEFP